MNCFWMNYRLQRSKGLETTGDKLILRHLHKYFMYKFAKNLLFFWIKFTINYVFKCLNNICITKDSKYTKMSVF